MAEKYVVVGFRVDQSSSVYFIRADGIERCLEKIRIAFKVKGAQFVSVRQIEQTLPNTD
jgi:hypothetical protein